MPKYVVTIDTDSSPDREAGLQKVVEDYNLSTELPPETPGQYLQRVLDIAVDSYTAAYLASRGSVLAVKFAKADPTTRASVEDLLAAIPAESLQPQL